jgi:hypothetical protein
MIVEGVARDSSSSLSSTAALTSTTAISCPTWIDWKCVPAIYYDRGGVQIRDRVLPGEVSLTSDVDYLDRVSQQFHLESAALLGHSWELFLPTNIRFGTRNTFRT